MAGVFQFLQEGESASAGERTAYLTETSEDFSGFAGSPTVSPLASKGAILLSGPDTEKLLQGQLTCDVTQLKEKNSLKGALCDSKGRMLSSFLCVRHADDTVLLVMDKGLIDSTLETLKKYAVFYNVTMSNASDQFAVYGLQGVRLASLEPSPLLIAPITENLALAIGSAALVKQHWEMLSNAYRPCGEAWWTYLLIQSGEGEVLPQTRGEFIPQMLNFQHTDAVNFRKGCYTGQEIVARMQYLGKIKRRMYHLKIKTPQEIHPGEVVNTDNKSNVGTVVMATTVGEVKELLAVLTEEAIRSTTLSIGSFQGGFEVLPLPYENQFADTKV